MWSLMASEGESTTAHFFLGAGDEGLGTRGIGMKPEESDSKLLEDEEDEVEYHNAGACPTVPDSMVHPHRG
ncbi:hypothetical protein H8959_015947 [Pygathrix nigripes]